MYVCLCLRVLKAGFEDCDVPFTRTPTDAIVSPVSPFPAFSDVTARAALSTTLGACFGGTFGLLSGLVCHLVSKRTIVFDLFASGGGTLTGMVVVTSGVCVFCWGVNHVQCHHCQQGAFSTSLGQRPWAASWAASSTIPARSLSSMCCVWMTPPTLLSSTELLARWVCSGLPCWLTRALCTSFMVRVFFSVASCTCAHMQFHKLPTSVARNRPCHAQRS